jgi:dihydroflavonol-4-reductase
MSPGVQSIPAKNGDDRLGVAEDTILVTGATGFLGREIVRQLLSEAERTPRRDVHVLARSTSDRSALLGLAVTWHEGDLCDARSIDAAVFAAVRSASAAGRVAHVVHCGALISYRTADGARARAVNVEGTRALLESARRHGVGRFVFVSSVVTVGHTLRGAILDERAAFNNAGLRVDYVDTKRAAEELVLAAAPELDVVVVNPGVIFGPVDRISNTVRFIREIAVGRTPLAAPPGRISVVGVHDTACGTLLALERGRRGERYLLVESHLGTIELLNEIARRLDARPVRVRIARPIWSLLSACASAVDRIAPIEKLPPQALRTLGVDLCFDAAKARRELGWNPRPFSDVLGETIEHLRSLGLLELTS